MLDETPLSVAALDKPQTPMPEPEPPAPIKAVSLSLTRRLCDKALRARVPIVKVATGDAFLIERAGDALCATSIRPMREEEKPDCPRDLVYVDNTGLWWARGNRHELEFSSAEWPKPGLRRAPVVEPASPVSTTQSPQIASEDAPLAVDDMTARLERAEKRAADERRIEKLIGESDADIFRQEQKIDGEKGRLKELLAERERLVGELRQIVRATASSTRSTRRR